MNADATAASAGAPLPVRPDSQLRGLDIPAAITAGLAGGPAERRTMFAEAAIAAALRLEDSGVGAYPVRFLAGYVRSAGRVAALDLPEPLVGDGPRELARHWLTAARPADGTLAADAVDGDILFGRWLEAVAALIELRQEYRRRTEQAGW